MSVTLPLPPDELSLTLLSRAKALLDHALGHATAESELDGMLAILGLDNVVEYTLRAIERHLEVEDKTGKSLDTADLADLAGSINKFMLENYGVALPYLSEVKLLRKTRNLVQHGAADPRGDLKRFRTVVERFFAQSLEKIFGIAKDEVRVSVLIRNAKHRALVQTAEKHLDARDALEAIVMLRDAFEDAMLSRQQTHPVAFEAMAARLETAGADSALPFLFDALSHEIRLLSSGIDPARYVRYKTYVDHIPHEYNADERGGNAVMQRPWELADANFCYGFVTDILLKWQNEPGTAIYTVEVKDRYQFDEFIDGVKLDALPGFGIMGALGARILVRSFLTKPEEKERLLGLARGTTHEYRTERWKNGTLDAVSVDRFKIANMRARVATNRPAQWFVDMRIEQEPFTRRLWAARVTEQVAVLNLNTCTAEELASRFSYQMTLEQARALVALRIELGEIKTLDDLERLHFDHELRERLAASTTLVTYPSLIGA